MHQHQFFTIPETIDDSTRYYPTGNEWLSLPNIKEDGSLGSIGLLHMKSKGLLELAGKDSNFLQPVFMVNNQEQVLTNRRWQRLENWIPRFSGTLDKHPSLEVTGTIFSPPGHKGFVYLLEITNHERQTCRVETGWQGNWQNTYYNAFSRRVLAYRNTGRYNRWTRTLAFEYQSGLPVLGWALGTSLPLSELNWKLNGKKGEEAEKGETGEMNFSLSYTFQLAAGETGRLALFVGVNCEADGAATVVVDLQRHGWEALLAGQLSWLQARKTGLAGRTGALCDLNMFYNYFFARGKCLDTEETVLVTSRNPRYYVSATFWARDAFIWSLPGLLLVDTKAGREALLLGATRYRRHAGIHCLYIDGNELYPGFELDELCAWFIGLEHYLATTGDWEIMAESPVWPALEYFLTVLEKWKHPCGLYETFLSPTDDPVEKPFLTYNNVLVWKVWKITARLFRRHGDEDRAKKAERNAAALKEKIWQSCVISTREGSVFAWAVDEKGEAVQEDQPPGSLQLLSILGFCSPENEVYSRTVQWIYSPQNPYYNRHGKVKLPGCHHSPYPWVLNLAYKLLTGKKKEALTLLEQLELDNNLACETVDPATGKVKTGAAFAACAGYLAYTIYRASK